MEYFHTDDMTTINWLAGVLNHASTEGLKVRIAVEGTSLKVKLGEGAWTAPLSGTPDPYRDQSVPTAPPPSRPDWWHRTDVPSTY